MDEEYEKTVRWFLQKYYNDSVNAAAEQWRIKHHDRCLKCGCNQCLVAHAVTHMIANHAIDKMLVDEPALQAATIDLIGRFICEVLDTNDSEVAEKLTRCKQIFITLKMVEAMAEIINGENKTPKALHAAAGEEADDDSQDATLASPPNDTDNESDDMTISTDKNKTETLLDNPIKTDVAGVQFLKNGVQVQPPKGLTYRTLITALKQQAEEEERTVIVDETVQAFVLEGAYAFQLALKEKFGWVDNRPTPGFWGETPPRTIEVQIGLGETATVIWGRVVIPGITGYLSTGVTYKEGRFYFAIEGEIQQKYLLDVKELVVLTEKYVRERSIYKGKALKLDLPLPTDPTRFSPLNAPTFMNLSGVNVGELIFSDEVSRAIQTNLFNPVERTQLCRALGISLKRGNLLAGRPGVGKSLTAAVLAKKCVENGWTYFYVKHAKDVASMYRLAADYSPAVLFVEDIDQVAAGEERTPELNELLNTLDGIDTKGSDVMVVFTTNVDTKEMNSAFKRAGRLDFILDVAPPDANAVQRLIKLYSRGSLASNVDLERVGDMLAGQIPATIKEVCSRALLSAVGHMTDSDSISEVIQSSDLETAAFTMLEQMKLTTATEDIYAPEGGEEMAADILGKHLSTAISGAADKVIASMGHETSTTPTKNGKSKATVTPSAS
jgi:transitional endoplasmic reticulum ATPase